MVSWNGIRVKVRVEKCGVIIEVRVENCSVTLKVRVEKCSIASKVRVEKCGVVAKVRVEKCGIVAKVRVEKCIFALFLCYKSNLNYQRNQKAMRYGKIISMSPYREQDWMKNIPLYAVEESF